MRGDGDIVEFVRERNEKENNQPSHYLPSHIGRGQM